MRVRYRTGLVYLEMPSWTQEALRRKVEGEVRQRDRINKNGTVRSIRLIRPLGYGLDATAMDAVSHWVFAKGPATLEVTLPFRREAE